MVYSVLVKLFGFTTFFASFCNNYYHTEIAFSYLSYNVCLKKGSDQLFVYRGIDR